MTELVLQPTILAQWHALVSEAMVESDVHLNEELESYLVFLLMRFAEKPELAKSVLALEFLEAAQQFSREKQGQMRDVGDKCLLFAGLFPRRAEAKGVKISYFVNLGKSAYTSLSHHPHDELALLFGALSEDFVPLMDVLLASRELNQQYSSLLPLQAMELWADTGSEYAFKTLRGSSTATNFIVRSGDF